MEQRTLFKQNLERENTLLEEPEEVMPAKNVLQLSCEIDDVLTYAIVHIGAYVVRDVCVKNVSEADLDNLVVKISANIEMVENFKFGIEKIKPDEELHFKNLNVPINAGYLASLTERNICQLTVGIYFEETQLASQTVTITALAFDQWPGLQYTPELLAAFSMPNHPVVTSIIQLASKYLEKWTEDPSLAGYQFQDPNRVKNMAAAVYAAIQQKNITYAEPPSSFEVFGQRIRLADAVLDQHLGTCMDMTLLYVACLEAMGLNSVMVMMKGHIFAGVWLLEESFSDMIMDDPSQLEKRMSKGIHEMIVVECTAMCAGKSRSFDEAVTLAEREVSNYGNFAFVIDVKRARSMGIRPLPVRVKTSAGFEVQHEERKEKDVTNAPKAIGDTFELPDSAQKDTVTKLTQWERKLLDLSLRNMLINMRMTKAVVPLLSSDVSILEDALSDGEEFQVIPEQNPSEFLVELKRDYKNVVIHGNWNEEEPKTIGRKSCPLCGYPLQLKYKNSYGLRLYICTNEPELCGFMTNEHKAGKLSILKCDQCRDGYLIVKSSKSNDYFQGCTNYKKDGTGCNNVISKNKFYDIMGYELESDQLQETKDDTKSQLMHNSQSDTENKKKQKILHVYETREDSISIKIGKFEPVLCRERDLNEIVHCILSALQSVSNVRYYGITMLTDVLVGNTSKRLLDNKLNTVPQFGKINYASRDEIYAIIEWLIDNKFILKTKGQYPVLHPTYNGMHYDEKMTLKQLKQLKRYLEQQTKNVIENVDIRATTR